MILSIHWQFRLGLNGQLLWSWLGFFSSIWPAVGQLSRSDGKVEKPLPHFLKWHQTSSISSGSLDPNVWINQLWIWSIWEKKAWQEVLVLKFLRHGVPEDTLGIGSVASKLLVALVLHSTEDGSMKQFISGWAGCVPGDSPSQLVLAGCQFLSYRGGVCYLFVLPHEFFLVWNMETCESRWNIPWIQYFFSFICSRMARLLPNRIQGSSWYGKNKPPNYCHRTARKAKWWKALEWGTVYPQTRLTKVSSTEHKSSSWGVRGWTDR